jgi:hypothetical protein
MPIKPTVDEIRTAVGAALDDAASAYDELAAELTKTPPDSTEVLRHSGKLWTSSLKASALLILAPAKIAEAIVTEGD